MFSDNFLSDCSSSSDFKQTNRFNCLFGTLEYFIEYRIFVVVPPCELTQNGGCAQNCTDNGDVAVCSCKEPAFKLADDKKGCDKGKIIVDKKYI